MMRNQAGFTLLELLITLSIVAIILGVGTPSFLNLSQDNNLIGQTNSMLGTIRFARSEAIKRNTDVIICQSSNGVECTNLEDWTQGMMVFVDTNNNGVYEAPANPDAIDLRVDDLIIKIQDDLDVDYTISSATYGAAQPLSFNSSGYLDNSGDIKICDQRGEDYCRVIAIELSGRTRNKNSAGKYCTI